ncbi:hypothetical protein BKA70DRAFT_1233159 [Coprinopsis sp. MPI-PUGE-AT-0042]|nr:hypothetical protein BKA70DRAFT_1233159 [Coprinopsis sp. MPI-PUGE-AT-0042]
MSSGTSTSSRASPHCRTCREPMRGHPRPTCAEIQRLEELGVISRAPSTLSELESISSATKVEASYQAPPTIEELTAFLLGVDHPVDPAQLRFALSTLGKLEEGSSAQDDFCDGESDAEGTVAHVFPKHQAHREQRTARRGSKFGILWMVFTHLLGSMIASGLTILILGSPQRQGGFSHPNPLRQCTFAYRCLGINSNHLELLSCKIPQAFRRSGALTGHTKKCKALLEDLAEARSSLGASQSKKEKKRSEPLEWAENLHVDKPYHSPDDMNPSTVASTSSPPNPFPEAPDTVCLVFL